ncbi:uncharacterized mitochondrial protein AtMg00810-like [Beta vulgaris subsp. vulgaris]|uniref:uncharacterized mitochondrial protein AtMg00810-like n=1 Tax=Beta vulgaris subsp. vulgaris TaxID=3555 RepID=UPI002036D1FA|nr:uncharacterized mitochondrial protein AtMg00810-like [Beta vulgaris subsp. vulgaris]
MAYLLLYTNDIILTASNTALLTRIIGTLSRKFVTIDLGSLHHFLGITASHSSTGLFLSQEQYAKDILARTSMAGCNSVTTPVDTTSKLSATDGSPVKDPTLYRSLAGALQYLSFPRPDIAYAVQQICLFVHAPREPHFHFLKRVLRYLKGILHHGLSLSVSTSHSLTAYSDADWAGCLDFRRSTSGYRVFLGDNLVSWQETGHCFSV